MTGLRLWNHGGRGPGRRGRRTPLLLVVPLVASLAMTWSVLPAQALPSAGQSTSTELDADAGSDPTEGTEPEVDPTTPGPTTETDPEDTDSTGSTEVERRRGKRSVIKIATFNAAAFQSNKRAVRDVRRLAHSGIDVMGLQEMASAKRRKRVHDQLVGCRGCPWAAHVPGGGAVRASTPIYWKREQYKLMKRGAVFVTPPTRVGRPGAGPARMNAKYITFVRLRDRGTGRTLWVLNNHAVPSVQGKNGGANKARPARLRLYKKHMIKLQRLVRECTRKGGLVFAIGDFNVNFRTDRRTRTHRFPSYRLGRVGLRNSYGVLGEPALGSHSLRGGRSTRLIDHVWFTPRRTLTPTHQRVMRGYSSDHRPVKVSFKSRAGRR